MDLSIRRYNLEHQSDSEKAIYNAMQEVEKMPAHENLTRAICLLAEAQEIVANYVDDTYKTVIKPQDHGKETF